jgi:hypothetical protein
MGLPAFSSYRNDLKLRQARQMILEDVRLARQYAVTRRAPVYIRFGAPPTVTGITSYQVHIDTNGNGLVDTGERVWIRRFPATTSVSVGLSPTDTLGFDTSGILLPGEGGGMLVTRNIKDRRDTLVVSSAGIIYKP